LSLPGGEEVLAAGAATGAIDTQTRQVTTPNIARVTLTCGGLRGRPANSFRLFRGVLMMFIPFHCTGICVRGRARPRLDASHHR
jgi:hypothetical protein